MDDGSPYADHLEALEPPADPAADVYARFIRDVISPELRQLGFQGSAGRYRLKGTDDHALVAFQKGYNNSAWEITFTINLTYISADAWAEARREHTWLTERRPNGLAHEPARGWYERIGMLDDPPGDRWWALRTQDDVPVVAEDVLRLLRDEAVPELRRQLAATPPPDPWSTDAARTDSRSTAGGRGAGRLLPAGVQPVLDQVSVWTSALPHTSAARRCASRSSSAWRSAAWGRRRATHGSGFSSSHRRCQPLRSSTSSAGRPGKCAGESNP